MCNFCRLSLLLILVSLNSLKASPLDYIYPNQSLSYSNYGTTGLISMPNARFQPEGTLGFSWSKLDPYLRGSILAYPFNWFEASYYYVDINNKLYSEIPEFSGGQSLKDKGFNAKFLIRRETNRFPAIAIGFRDMAGTGLFEGEYLVASKRLNSIDFTLGLGWGTMSKDTFSNPLKKIDNSFSNRTKQAGSIGGEFSSESFFSGDLSIFGGLEIFLPYLNGARLKVELDTIDYNKEGYPPIKQESSLNYAFVYPIGKNTQFSLGIVRGNTINFTFSITGNYGSRNPHFKKNDPHIPVENADAVKRVVTRRTDLIHNSALKYLNERDLFLQSANYEPENGKYTLAYSQSKYMSYIRSTGRVLRTLDEILPDSINKIEVITLNANMGMNSIEINRDEFKRKIPFMVEDLGLSKASVNPVQYDIEDFNFAPKSNLPKTIFAISPSLRSQIGGPDGFYFGDLRIALNSELIIRKNLSIAAKASVGIFDNYEELKLRSASVLPHVRTDIVDYLKESKEFALEHALVNYYKNIKKDFYFRLSGGLFEPMFGGIGGEMLYRPIYGNYGIGIEAWRVKQRNYNQRLGFRDYSTSTGFINLHYHHSKSDIQFNIKGGRFLAKDSGIQFGAKRVFRTGTEIGAFFTLTDISKEEFGEGSFDKGFFFHIPLESFFTTYRRGFTGFGLRPVTRDGGAHLSHPYTLWGVTHQGSLRNILMNWDEIYD